MAKPESNSLFRADKITWLLFALTAAALYFFALGTIPLLGPDEPRYAQVAREMWERGDLVTPTLGAHHWFEKPALLYWLQYAAYSVFGVSEFSARFGSACFGLLTVLSLYLMLRGIGDRDLARWTALIAATSLGLMVFARGGSFDIILTFPVAASLVCFFLADLRAWQNRSAVKYLLGFYFFIGVALLAKGLIGVVIPAAVAGLYLLFLRKFPSRQLLLSAFWGAAVALLVAATWYLPMYQRHGWEFIDEFFVQHHFARYTSNKYLHPGPFWYFWLVLPAMTLPWLPFLLSAVWGIRKWKIFNPETEIDRLRLFALAWVLFPLLFFSLSGSKLAGYILPALPGCCILIGESVWRFVGASKKREFALKSVTFIMLASVAVLLQFYVNDFARHDHVKELAAAADRRGYEKARFFNLHDVSHSLEFYGAGRLVRNSEGAQIRFALPQDILDEMAAKDERQALIVTPPRFVKDLQGISFFDIEPIADNDELAIVALIRK
jgi:4-amino-4-deoxy-L-arabinose transferase-like glycosyltransferase